MIDYDIIFVTFGFHFYITGGAKRRFCIDCHRLLISLNCNFADITFTQKNPNFNINATKNRISTSITKSNIYNPALGAKEKENANNNSK